MGQVEVLIEKEVENTKYSITRILNLNGHPFFQFRINGEVRWYFKAYVYEPDGVTSHEIVAPYGLSAGLYERALKEIMSTFNIT